MRVFAVSDIHADFEENFKWLNTLSLSDFREDILILAGDISGNILIIEKVFKELKKRFAEVFFVPGNHDLWVHRRDGIDSLKKLDLIYRTAENYGIRMQAATLGYLSIIPLLGWYDYTFGMPSEELFGTWMDYSACIWPELCDEKSITAYFTGLNEKYFGIKNSFIISFSHFLPRIDIMPTFIPEAKRKLYPVLGSSLIEDQIRKLKPNIHVYGHSHVNVCVKKDSVLYINNAFGYPYEYGITEKKLKCIFEKQG